MIENDILATIHAETHELKHTHEQTQHTTRKYIKKIELCSPDLNKSDSKY